MKSKTLQRCTIVIFLGGLSFFTAWRPAAAAEFLRGDADASGRLSVTDAVHILSFLFLGNPGAVTCQDAADADDNGLVELSDALFVLNTLFRGGSAPAAPFPFCGGDPTEDGLDCAEWKECPPVHEIFDFEVQAGAMFFVIDRSGMVSSSGGMIRAVTATVKTISAFPEGMQFGIFFVDAGLRKFPASGVPADATSEMKQSAIAWAQSTPGGGGSCDIPGLIGAIEMARQTRSIEKAIFYMTDGGGTCNAFGQTEEQYLDQMRKQVTQANAGLAHIHSVNVVPGPDDYRTLHLKELAALNGGTYHEAGP